MATGTHTLLERITVGAAGAASVTFSSIPQTGYTDLKIVVSGRTTVSIIDTYFNCNFNGDSGANYAQRSVYQGNTGNAVSNSWTAQNNLYVNSVNGASATASTFSNVEMYIPNYAGATYKSMSQDGANEHNAANPTTRFNPLSAGLWSSTAAITSIALSTASGTWVQYSTFSLYGIAAYGTTPTKAPKAVGGDIIQTDGTYWYHAFINTGAFVPATGLSCDVLVVAGGGGGGCNYAGGAGAGGLVYTASQSFGSGTSYTVTVGAGGAGSTSASTRGTVGVNSNITGGSLSLTAAVGGGGGGSRDGSGTQSAGGNGGSGGGAGADSNNSGGTATSGQGNNGGTSTNSGSFPGGGGGGAAAVGANSSSSTVAGAGGAGSSTYTSWGSATSTGQLVSSTYYYAGGGGGSVNTGGTAGAGGNGGGGAGTNTALAAGSAGTANTGGGGGGGGAGNGTGGLGGSGIIIVRYAV